ncbi:MAG: N-acetylmuramoyl-L-alanine amidase [Bacilli bacterium]
MKNITKIFKTIAVITLTFFLFACDNEQVDKAVLTVPNLQLELKTGETKAIETSVTNSSESTKIIFFSGNTDIATVDEQGNVFGQKAGQVTVIVYLEGEEESFDVTVKVVEDLNASLTTIKSWILEEIGTSTKMNVDLPVTDPTYDSVISWESSNEAVMTNAGVIFQKEYNMSTNLTFTINLNDQELTNSVEYQVIGYAYELVADEFLKQFNSLITRNYDNIKTTNYDYDNAIITWSSSNEAVFTSQGVYKKPVENTVFNIEVQVGFTDKEGVYTFQKQVTAQGITIYEKADIIEEKILNVLNLGTITSESIELPIYDDEYKATLTWFSNNDDVITTTGSYIAPIENQMVTLRCEITIDDAYDSFSIEIEAAGKHYDAKWDAVNDFLSLIFLDEIKTQRYTMYGATSYITYNYGYLPFYTNTRSVILDGMVPAVDRPGIIKTETKWVVIHDTANTNIGADAEMHTRYIKTNPGASWHYTVDDEETYQHIPNEEVAYHAGAKEGNNYGIGIETCVNEGVEYNTVMRRASKLTAELLVEFDLSIYNVRQHNYYSGKDCPHVMRAANRWNEYLTLVAIEYFALTNLSDVTFVWESLTPEVLDNTGKIISQAGLQTEVSYKVMVTYDNETREFSHSSTLLAKSW